VGLRVGIDASSLGDGGAATHLSELLQAASPADSGVSRIVVWCSPEMAPQLPQRPWLEVKTPSLLGGWRVLRPLWPLVGHNEIASSCDVLLVPGGISFGRFQPMVTMSRNLLPFDVRERSRYGWSRVGTRLRLLELLQTATFRRATATIFLTRTAQNIVQSRTGALRRCEVIPHGVSVVFRHTPRNQEPISAYSFERPLRLVYVSVLERYKHQLQVARAVAALRERHFPVVLDLVGPAGSTKAEVEQFLDEGDHRSFIRYCGPLAYSKLPELYSRSDAAVFASTCENMPNILVEKMAAGLPVACSNRGVMPEVFGGSGPTFDPESLESVTAALEKLVGDADLRRESARLSYARSEAFSWERCARETLNLLVSVHADGC